VPRLAIVICAVGNIESLETTLVSVLENRPDDCEIVVALNAPYADPYDLADEVRFLAPEAGGSTSAAINRALTVVRAPFVHLVASGCRVREGWAEAALLRFGDRQVASVVPLVWDGQASGRLLAAGVGYRPSGRRVLIGRGLTTLEAQLQHHIIGPCGFAGFYRKAALDFVGGFCPRLSWRQADADVALALRHAGFSVAIEPRSNLEATRASDACPGPYLHSLSDERLFWRNWTGPARKRALAGHLARVALELGGALGRPRMAAHLWGRLRGALEIIGHARHRRALAELDARAVRPVATGEHTRIDRSHRAPARPEADRSHSPERRAL
jgi:hypothetical protein